MRFYIIAVLHLCCVTPLLLDILDILKLFFDARLRLGDLGVLDDDGFLIVLGKLEEFITIKSGEVISPLRVSTFENDMMVQQESQLIGQHHPSVAVFKSIIIWSFRILLFLYWYNKTFTFFTSLRKPN